MLILFDKSIGVSNLKIEHIPACVWIVYQILIIYLNIFSQSLFLFLVWFFDFRTVKGIIGLEGNKRKEADFLDYVKEDIHWFSSLIIQVFMCIVALIYRFEDDVKDKGIKTTFTIVCLQLTIDALLIWYVFFTKYNLNMKKIVATLIISVFLNAALAIVLYTRALNDNVYWGPFVMQ